MNTARMAVNGLFFINGFGYANWIARLPRFQDHYGMDNGALGLVLLAHAIGALLAMPWSGWLIVRHGSRKVAALGAVFFILTVPILPLMPNVIFLGLWFAVMGSVSGVLDVSMNAQAVLVERRGKKPMMSSFHALFSVGMMIGAAIGALVNLWRWSLSFHLLIMGAVGLLLVLWCIRLLVNDDTRRQPNTPGPGLHWPDRSLWGIGLIAFCCMLGEGAMSDWSTNYLENIAFAKKSVAPLGLAAFSLAMVIGRVLGDRIREMAGDRKLLVVSSGLAFFGMALTLSFLSIPTIILGLFLVGLGLATVVPVAYSIAGNAPGLPPGLGISMVTTIGYSGFLFGPPIIGFLADGLNLRIALHLVLLLFFAMLVLSWSNKSPQRQPEDNLATAE